MLYENTRRLTPICGAASPARPGWSTVSSRSRTSAARSRSKARTGSAGVRSTGSPSSRMGRIVTSSSVSAQRGAPDQHHLVAVDDLPAVLRGEVPGLAAQQRRHLPGVVGGQPTRDDDAVGSDELDRVVGEEVTGDAGDPRRQQRGVPLPDGGDGTRVEHQPSARPGGETQPELPGPGPRAHDREERADRLAGQSRGGLQSGGDDDRHAGVGGDQRRLHLGCHPAGADPVAARGAERHGVEFGRIADGVDQPRRAPAGVAVVDAVDVGEQEQRLGPGDVRHQSGEPVVVAEPDLLGGHRVVLVDDRQRAEGQQPLEGPLGVAVVAAPGEVVGGQQDLADGDPVAGEHVGVGLHQPQLPDARRRLRRRQVTWATGEPERGQPGGDRAGGDEDDLAPGRPETGQHVDEGGQALLVQAAGQRGQRRGADLHDDPLRLGDLGTGAHTSSGNSASSGRSVQPDSVTSYGTRRARLAASRSAAPTRSVVSSRLSVPRPPSPDVSSAVSVPAGRVGTQSKVTSPMVTASPSWAPARASSSSTPSRLSRSARKPTASSLVKSVWRPQRSGFTPRTTNASGSSGSRSTVKPESSTARGASVTRAGSGGGRVARWSSTARASACPSAGSPSPVAALTGKTSSPRASSPGRTRSTSSRPSGTSILLRTAIRSRPTRSSSSPPYSASSCSSASMSLSGSRPGSIVAMSMTCKRTAQRSTCRRNCKPRPLPADAPGMSPGTSAIVYVVSPERTTPRFGTSVVNGWSAIFGRAADIAEISEDLPADGKPTRPTSATLLSSMTASNASPGSPSRANPGALRRGLASAALPRPPLPPCASTTRVPAPIRSTICRPSGVLTTVPSGTCSTRSSPRAPFRLLPAPGRPLPAFWCGRWWKSSRVCTLGSTSRTTSPPSPPLPPSGPPSGLNFSRWTEATPCPPLPAATWTVTRSTNAPTVVLLPAQSSGTPTSNRRRGAAADDREN